MVGQVAFVVDDRAQRGRQGLGRTGRRGRDDLGQFGMIGDEPFDVGAADLALHGDSAKVDAVRAGQFDGARGGLDGARAGRRGGRCSGHGYGVRSHVLFDGLHGWADVSDHLADGDDLADVDDRVKDATGRRGHVAGRFAGLDLTERLVFLDAAGFGDVPADQRHFLVVDVDLGHGHGDHAVGRAAHRRLS